MICFPYWKSTLTSIRNVGLQSIFQKSMLSHTRYLSVCEILPLKEAAVLQGVVTSIILVLQT